jgi:5-hydroxyisourate hydrolase
LSISAEAFDGVYGRPAAGIRVRLEIAGANGWEVIAHADSDSAGRVTEWGPCIMARGLYRMILSSGRYFTTLGAASAYPEVAITFKISAELDSYRVHVTLTPYSYSTYLTRIPHALKSG